MSWSSSWWQVAKEMYLKDLEMQREKEEIERRARLEAQQREEERLRKAEEYRLQTQKVHRHESPSFGLTRAAVMQADH